MKYGWLHMFKAILVHLPIFWYFFDECESHEPFCSEAIARSYRKAGIDLCPKIPDRFTFPGDLAKSPFLERVE